MPRSAGSWLELGRTGNLIFLLGRSREITIDVSTSTRDMQNDERGKGGTSVLVRLQPNQLAKLDTWIANQPKSLPFRLEAVRRVLEARLLHEEERRHL